MKTTFRTFDDVALSLADGWALTFQAAVADAQRRADANGAPVGIWTHKDTARYAISETAPDDWADAPEMAGWLLDAVIDPDLAPLTPAAPRGESLPAGQRPEGGTSARREGDTLPAPSTPPARS